VGRLRRVRWLADAKSGGSRLTRGSAFGEEGVGLFGGVGFAALGLGEADVEALAEGVAIPEEPVFCGGFCFEEIEGVGEEFGVFSSPRQHYPSFRG